jgi:hypothetical protein
MGQDGGPRLAVRALVEAVDAAAPVDAVDEVADQRREVFGAWRVALLIADRGGRSIVRLTVRKRDGQAGSHAADESEEVALSSSVYEWMLQTQQPSVEDDDGCVCVPGPGDRPLATPSARWRWRFPSGRTSRRWASWRRRGDTLAYIVIAGRRFTECAREGSAPPRCRWPRRSSIGCCGQGRPAHLPG